MEQPNVLFTVMDLTIWQVFRPWGFLFFFAAPFLVLAIPRLASVWPFTAIGFVQRRRWRYAIMYYAILTVVFVGHFTDTQYTLEDEKRALASDQYTLVTAPFDDPQPEPYWLIKLIWGRLSLSFGGKGYDMPGGLYGSQTVLPKIVKALDPGATYRLYVAETSSSRRVILKIERPAALPGDARKYQGTYG